MKRIAALLIGVLCALSAALIGCSASSQDDSSKVKAQFVGTWNAVEMTGENGYDKEQMEAMKSLGLMDIYLNLEEDGKAALSSTIGKESALSEGTWDMADASHLTITFNGVDTEIAVEDGNLTMPGKDSSVVFEKGEAREPLSAGGTTGSNASSATSTKSSGDNEDKADAKSEPSSSSSVASSSAGSQESKSSAKYEASIDDVTVGANYKGEPVLIVTYSWKNNSEKTRSFASTLRAECYQDGVQLSPAIMFEGIDSEGYMADVRPGYGTSAQRAYELKNEESPVEIEVTELISWDDEILASKVFEF